MCLTSEPAVTLSVVLFIIASGFITTLAVFSSVVFISSNNFTASSLKTLAFSSSSSSCVMISLTSIQNISLRNSYASAWSNFFPFFFSKYSMAFIQVKIPQSYPLNCVCMSALIISNETSKYGLHSLCSLLKNISTDFSFVNSMICLSIFLDGRESKLQIEYSTLVSSLKSVSFSNTITLK